MLKKIIISLLYFLFLFIGMSAESTYEESNRPLKVVRDWEIKFDYQVSFFLSNNQVYVYDHQGKKISQYHDGILKKTIPVKKGKGPGDFLSVMSFWQSDKNLIIWDGYEKKANYFSPDLRFIKTERFPLKTYMGNLLGIYQGNFYLQWSSYIKRKIIRKIGYFDREGKVNVLYELGGFFFAGKTFSFDRPLLVSAFLDNKIYFASNREYKIYSINLKSDRKVSEIFLTRKIRPMKWTNAHEKLKLEVVRDFKAKYAEFVPPVYALVSSQGSQMIGVVTNERVLNKESKIDLYEKNGKYLGSVVLPMFQDHYFLFRADADFYLNLSIALGQNYLIIASYDKDRESYKIIKWVIRF